MSIEPCPALPDGTARQCGHCDDDIEIGADASKNTHGVWCHVTCVDHPPIAGAVPEWVPPPPPDKPDDVDAQLWEKAVTFVKHFHWETRENYELRLKMFCAVYGGRR